jgi:hypothetical protein
VNVQQVECTNCGGDDLLAIVSLAIAGIGLIVAILAAVLAKRAADSADDSLKIGRDALDVAREEAKRSKVEHDEFRRQMEARARFDVTVRALPPADEDGMFVLDATSVNVHVEIGISNKRGDKAAHTTTVNVLVPENTQNIRWSGPRGEPRPTESSEMLWTSETLTNAGGNVLAVEYLSRQLPRITRRTHYLVHVTLSLPIPDRLTRSVPIRVRVESDDLPDDQPEVVVDYMLRGRRLNPVA